MDSTAPMPGLAPVQQRMVPLTCNICPKKPRFSDLSHLLTHISSKAHLSTYYNIKVRAAADGAARQVIEQYDIWYAEYEIEALMSERLSQKDNRKGKSRIKSDARAARKIKTEPGSQGNMPLAIPFVDPSSLLQHQGLHHPYAPMQPMHMWNPNQFMFAPKQEYEDDQSSDVSSMPNKTNSKRSRASKNDSVNADDDDSSKLKGVYWPGMGLFDAATPELRKKRNQKKDVSVNDRLAAASQEIERTEMIFSPSGSFRKSRVISGVPESDSDPLPGEESPPRPKKVKRTNTRRKPLESKDPNISSRAARAKGKKRAHVQPQPLMPTPQMLDEEEDDDQLTYDTLRGRRRKVSVFHDDEASFEQPATMTHLTSGYQQTPVFQPAAPMGFRPAEATYMPPQSYYQYPTGYGGPYAYDPTGMAAWDYYGHGVGHSMTNPLFPGFEQADMNDDDEDDEETISAPISGSDK